MTQRVAPAPEWIVDLFQRAGVSINGPEPWDPQVKDSRFYTRLARDGALGLGESYVDGWWDCERLDELAFRGLRSDADAHMPATSALWFSALRARVVNVQAGRGGEAVAKRHYDLPEELFEAMLGRTMAYSCAYWPDRTNLDDAQEAKLELICRKLELRGGERILDIGCGWGSFIRYAAERYGCATVGITNSERQSAYAKRWCEGLSAEALFLDYRSPSLTQLGPFDRVVSVGMFEHVGQRNFGTFMRVVRGLLATNGLFLLHTMGRTVASKHDLWIDRYIFPNSYIPDEEDVVRCSKGLFITEDWHSFGRDYDHTLMAWYNNFERYARDRAQPLDQQFHRMWRYYLLTFAGCFRSRKRLQLWQLVYSPQGVAAGYRSVR